mmetsp:Transcript_6870/g.21698  ORF Transcript_6870/g.21698 Transcript_6870/m.21698 type:complete len:313 (+) Transcript_6870:620-1558(+)
MLRPSTTRARARAAAAGSQRWTCRVSRRPRRPTQSDGPWPRVGAQRRGAGPRPYHVEGGVLHGAVPMAGEQVSRTQRERSARQGVVRARAGFERGPARSRAIPNWHARPREPRKVVAAEHGRQLGEALGVVAVDPAHLGSGEQREVEQLALERDDSQVLKAEVLLAAERVLRARLAHGHDVLEPNPKAPLLVVTGLVGERHSFLQRDGIGRDARQAHAVRTLVHVEEGADAMPRAVPVVEPRSPQWRASDCVKLVARGARGEDEGVNGDVRLQHARPARSHVRARVGRSQVYGARNVRRAAHILAARVAQEE